MEFKVLGPLEVWRDGAMVAIGGAKPRALLASLLLHANEPVSAERLALALWGEEAPAGAAATVRVHVSRLRRALGDEGIVATTAAGYHVRLRTGELDLDRFLRLVEEGREALGTDRADDAAGLLREALALWRGPALADLANEPFAGAAVAALEEQRFAALESCFEADLAAGRHVALVGELRRLVAEHPLRERLHGQLMLALYRCGRQADALAAYRDARAVLVEHLGIEPGSELRALERAVLAQDPELLLPLPAPARTGASPTRAPAAGHVRVPLPPTATVGREAELAALEELVDAQNGRLITVVGPGGVGKTRVAIELARAVGPRLRDGAVFVSLGPLAASDQMPSTVARELGVTPARSESVEDALVRHLAQREVLLVLDNFEHLLDAAPFVAELLATAPDLTVLATSREPLRLRAERLFQLEPLAVRGESDAAEVGPAVALFVGAVQARDRRFTLSEDGLPAIDEVCRRLDGLPLALELAAGRVGVLSLRELAARLRAGLEPLDAAPRDAPSRQRTLSATLQWSYDLLDEDEQFVLAALSVFAGGCTVEAAQAVTGAPLAVLESLVAKNLVVARPSPDGGRRLALLETVRVFARSLLVARADAGTIDRAHCEHFLALAERTRPELERTTSQRLLRELDREIHNLRAAYAWAFEHAPELALRCAVATATYWFLSRLTSQAERWLAGALETSRGADAAVRAAAMHYYAVALANACAFDRAESVARESLALRTPDDLSGRARSSSAIAWVLLHSHQTSAAYHHAREAVRLAEFAGDDQARVWGLGTMALAAPTVQEALRVGNQVIDAYREAENERELLAMRTSLVYVALDRGAHAAAEPLSLEALAEARASDDPFVLAMAEGNAGLAALFNDHLRAAQRAFASELRIGLRHGLDTDFAVFMYEGVSGMAAVAAARGDDATAATLYGAAEAAALERHPPGIARRLDERFLARARARLGEHVWADAYAAGGALGREQAMEVALRAAHVRAVA